MKDPLEPYWTALGRFLHRYALVEATLNYVLRETVAVDYPTALAVFSGTRVKDAMSFIKRIHEAKKLSQSEWLDRAFPKLSEITTARDKILHHGFALDGDKIVVSDRNRNIARAVYEREYKVADLNDLEADTCVIHACLNMHWLSALDGRRLRAMRNREREIALTPWRHKPRAPKQSQPNNPKAARKR